MDIDTTLMPPRALLRQALMYVQAEQGGVLPNGNVDTQATVVAVLLKLIVQKFRELAINRRRRASMYKQATTAQKVIINNIAGRVVLEQNSCTPISRSLSTSSLTSGSPCSGGGARRFDDDADLEAELASLEEDDDELDALIRDLENESGVHPSPRSC